ncbi:MAG TPA: hypothetical protein VFV34_18565 [Blastocatellia bacterium]|nr:hypothetical protein [Blastocatellia bacterium]
MSFIELHEDGYLQLHSELPTAVDASLVGMLRRFWLTATIYGDDGVAWRMTPAPEAVPKPSSLLRVLANTFYNPKRRVPVVCEKIGDYDLADLKARIAACVAGDDDILTQFIEASEINELLARARTFDDIVTLVRRIQGEGDAD